MGVLPSSNQANTTIRFNVGGKICEVSKSLLEQYPDTMLARLASDTWHPGSESRRNEEGSFGGGNAALFIERDGERFRYCLDYMRDGGDVVLPHTIPKDALLQDLVYYGFEGIDQSKISVVGSLSTFKGGIEHINLSLTNLKNEILYLEMKRKCWELVKYCLCYYVQEASLRINMLNELENSMSSGQNEELRAMVITLPYNDGFQRQFNEYLKIFGLKFTKSLRFQLFLEHL
jgi:hypothetical protein